MSHPFSVAVLTPSTGICRMGYAQSLARLVMYFAQVRVFEDIDKQNLCPYAVEGSGIAANYEQMVEKFLADENIHWTHFLSVEDDMVFSPDCLHTLARRKLDIVGANYSVNKGQQLRFTASNFKSRVLTTPESTGVERVDLLCQGFTLVSRYVYESLEKPWFMQGYCKPSGNHISQDYYFSEKAGRAGFQVYVDHDVSKRVAHVGPKNYTWHDALRDELALLEKGEDISYGDITGSLQPEVRERQFT